MLDGWIRPEAWIDARRPPVEYVSNAEMEVFRLDFSERQGSRTTVTMHHLIRSSTGIEHFAEVHEYELVPTSSYVDALEAAGLSAEVLPEYMPGRDRLVGVKQAQ